MSIKTLLYICILPGLASCHSIKYAQDSQLLSKEEVDEDIQFLKRELVSRHYNLNWEGRQQIILSELDSMGISHSDITTQFFLQNLSDIVKTIDDGHTVIFSFRKEDRYKLKKAIEPKSFSCLNLDHETVLLRIPGFTDKTGIAKSLTVFNTLVNKPEVNRLIIDLRNNQGGELGIVSYFLKHILTHETTLCITQQNKVEKGVMGMVRNLSHMIKGAKKSDNYMIRKCKKLKGRNTSMVANNYVLVDSTIVSGSMLAVYHLKKAGYTVIGNNPSSLFNTFGNSQQINLPNSHLYVGISTLRIILDANYLDRKSDMLVCDIHVKNESLDEILEITRQYEEQ